MELTDDLKMSILSLKGEGFGNRVIANKLGLSFHQVRGYCRTKSAHVSADGMGIDLLDMTKKAAHKPKERVCEYCGNKFHKKVGDSSSYKFCSADCKESNEIKKAKETLEKNMKPCKACGKLFPKRGSSAYCSVECRYETRNCAWCGESFEVFRYSTKRFCSQKCARHSEKKTHEEYYQNFSSIHKGSIVPMNKYVGSDYDMTVWCIECQKQTTRKAGQFIDKSRVRGCSHCGRTLSTGENVIERWLDDNNIHYIKQYSVDTLIDKAPLRYDFAITNEQQEVVMLLEYDGRQHYEPVDNFGGEKEFNRQVRSDQMKNDYANDNGIELIRISYKQKKDIANILATII